MCVCVHACVCVCVCVCVAKPVAVELRCHATALIVWVANYLPTAPISIMSTMPHTRAYEGLFLVKMKKEAISNAY